MAPAEHGAQRPARAPAVEWAALAWGRGPAGPGGPWSRVRYGRRTEGPSTRVTVHPERVRRGPDDWALQNAGFDDWTLARCRVFQRAVPDGSHLTDLVDQAQITKQGASVLVDQLERLGYVRRVPGSSDGRAQLIVIERSAHARSWWPRRHSTRSSPNGRPTRAPATSVAAPDPRSTPRDHRPLRALNPAPPGRHPRFLLASSVSADGAGRRSTLV